MTIYAPDALRNRVKAHAADRGQSMSEFVVQTLTETLDAADAKWKEVILNGLAASAAINAELATLSPSARKVAEEMSDAIASLEHTKAFIEDTAAEQIHGIQTTEATEQQI